ncbi:hypothetical protein A7985_06635 [Pseudoalteromonas luteoviolacea]|uniref:DoxX family protein n=1 Tax=Pseudoalteromonas luteoviolacea TaxID=43657 RepID=A0A1C0TWB1_9GAMM|nr:DoxX family membrane protein [Pseudoalteromonas luteoviolacea]MBQ4810141.1 DoxX family membrane protein [Pseudoalteromonas luteoviolacea]OCQ23615.1 hypothetical protein A7985_06635 [Pseudoalteromonas luteoviolacea]
MFSESQLPQHISINVLARFLFTSLFLLSGITHFTNLPYYLNLMPEAIPYKVALIWVSGVVELVGAGMILLNWRPKLGGWLLVIFLLPVTIVVHGYEMLYAEHEVVRALQQAHFLKGFALIGAALLITQIGVYQKEKS